MDGRLIDVCIATIIYFVLLFYVKKQKGCAVIVLAIIFLFLSFVKVTIPTTYFWIFFAMTGIVMYEQFARFTYYTFYSKFWPIAKGKITHSGIKEKSVRQKWKEFTVYRPSVHYQYTVKEKNFSGHWITYGNNFNEFRHKLTALSIIRRFPLGAEVEIYYDPKYNNISVLTNQVRWNGILLALVGLFIAILGVWNGLFSEPSFFTFVFFR